MPSQLSTNTSAAASDSYRLQVDKTGGHRPDNNGVQACKTAVTDGVASSCNMKTEAMEVSVEEVGSKVSSMAHKLCNGDSPPVEAREAHHNGYCVSEVCNEVPALSPTVSCPKTQGSYSNEGGSVTGHCDEGRLVCPQDVLQQQAGELVDSRIEKLETKQRELATRFASLEVSLQERQIMWISQHVCGQVGEIENRNGEEVARDEGSEFNGSVSQWAFPIQVDGASDDTFLTRVSMSEMEVVHDEVGAEGVVNSNCAPSKSRCEESFSSVDSLASASSITSSYIDGEGDAPSRRRSERVLKAHATCISALLDEDLTDTSSDEEDTEVQGPVEQSKRSLLKHSWSMSRMMVGSRWLWLQRKIAELNKLIYLLDHHVKGSYRQDHCTFGTNPPSSSSSSSTSSSSLLTHPYFPFSNGSTLEKLRAVGNALGAAGATGNTHPLLPLAKAAALTTKHSAMANGFTAPPTSQSLSYLPHLLLPEGLLSGGRLQVKELLSPSPLGQNLMCLDEGTCSRTRPLLKRSGYRRVVRMPRYSGRVRGMSLDSSRHSHLSMPHELPSRVLLDSVMRDALTDHSYARLPLSKRRRAASSLPFLATPTVTMDTVLSTSPSPNHTPYSLESSRGGQPRKKICSLQQQTSYESISTASTLGGNNGSPWSPGISRPPTPNSTPQSSSARKKKMSHSTPLFDIDNIVIPYSIASSTRLEKLEYKEIITPRWRKVGEGGGEDNDRASETRAESEPIEEEEELTDEVFMKRHNRSEMNEKKRFLNFISGSNHRRRVRPHSVTLSESPSCVSSIDASLASPPLRRVTVTSPIPIELETCRLPDVQPWQPRKFPLSGDDEKALHDPPPPPPPTFLSSPIKRLHASTPRSRSPSCTTSAYNTPLGSPPSTPIEDTPSSSPAEWVVNSHFSTSSTGHSLQGLQQLPTVLTSSPSSSSLSSPSHFHPQQHQPIILKLTKKT